MLLVGAALYIAVAVVSVGLSMSGTEPASSAAKVGFATFVLGFLALSFLLNAKLDKTGRTSEQLKLAFSRPVPTILALTAFCLVYGVNLIFFGYCSLFSLEYC